MRESSLKKKMPHKRTSWTTAAESSVFLSFSFFKESILAAQLEEATQEGCDMILSNDHLRLSRLVHQLLPTSKLRSQRLHPLLLLSFIEWTWNLSPFDNQANWWWYSDSCQDSSSHDVTQLMSLEKRKPRIPRVSGEAVSWQWILCVCYVFLHYVWRRPSHDVDKEIFLKTLSFSCWSHEKFVILLEPFFWSSLWITSPFFSIQERYAYNTRIKNQAIERPASLSDN